MKHFFVLWTLGSAFLTGCSHGELKNQNQNENAAKAFIPSVARKINSIAFYKDGPFVVVQQCIEPATASDMPFCQPKEGLKSARVPLQDFTSSYKDYLFKNLNLASDWERELDYYTNGFSKSEAKDKVKKENFINLLEQAEYLKLEIETREVDSKEYRKLKNSFLNFQNQFWSGKFKVPADSQMLKLKKFVSQFIDLLPQRNSIVFSNVKNDFSYKFLESYLDSDIVRSTAGLEPYSYFDYRNLMGVHSNLVQYFQNEWVHVVQYLVMHDAYNSIDAKYRTYSPLTFKTDQNQSEVAEAAALLALDEWTLKNIVNKKVIKGNEYLKYQKLIREMLSRFDADTIKEAKKNSSLVVKYYLNLKNSSTKFIAYEGLVKMFDNLQIIKNKNENQVASPISLRANVKIFLAQVRKYTLADAIRLQAGEMVSQFDAAILANKMTAKAQVEFSSQINWLKNVINENKKNSAPSISTIDGKPFSLFTKTVFDDQGRRKLASLSVDSLEDLLKMQGETLDNVDPAELQVANETGAAVAEQLWKKGFLAVINGANDKGKSFVSSQPENKQ